MRIVMDINVQLEVVVQIAAFRYTYKFMRYPVRFYNC